MLPSLEPTIIIAPPLPLLAQKLLCTRPPIHPPPSVTHVRLGWYIGPPMEHYWCFKVYFPYTLYECDVLKVDFFRQKVAFPSTTNKDYLRQTAEDMLLLLIEQSPLATSNPLSFGVLVLNAFGEVARLLGRAVSNPATVIALDPVVTPIQLPTLPLQQHGVTPPRVSPTYTYPYAVPIPLSHPPIAPPRVTDQYFHPSPLAASPPSSAHYIPPMYHNTRAHPTVLPDNPLHYINSAKHNPAVSGKIHNPTTGWDETIDSLLVCPDAAIWKTPPTNKLGRCAQGISKQRSSSAVINGTQTIFLIKPHQVPAVRKVTYANFVCTMRPTKAEVYRIQMTVGSDNLNA